MNKIVTYGADMLRVEGELDASKINGRLIDFLNDPRNDILGVDKYKTSILSHGNGESASFKTLALHEKKNRIRESEIENLLLVSTNYKGKKSFGVQHTVGYRLFDASVIASLTGLGLVVINGKINLRVLGKELTKAEKEAGYREYLNGRPRFIGINDPEIFQLRGEERLDITALFNYDEEGKERRIKRVLINRRRIHFIDY